VDLHQITENLSGRKDIIHSAVEHRPSIADIRTMKPRRFSPFLKDPDGNLFGQTIQVNASRMTAAENIFHQDLGFAQILFIPACPTTQGIYLNPVLTNLSTSLLTLIGHNDPPGAMIRFLILYIDRKIFSM
jgi:hypothetical protein